jgi:hypothetical protein
MIWYETMKDEELQREYDRLLCVIQAKRREIEFISRELEKIENICIQRHPEWLQPTL